MRKNVINIGRVKSNKVQAPWWMFCPLCPVGTGFGMHKTQESAWDAAERHLFKRHPNATDAKSWFDEVQLRVRLNG